MQFAAHFRGTRAHSSTDRVADFESEGWRFESSWARLTEAPEVSHFELPAFFLFDSHSSRNVQIRQIFPSFRFHMAQIWHSRAIAESRLSN
jgi:hypothetical protein